MTHIYEKAYFGNKIVPIGEARLSIASSAVLYGLSVYTVFPVLITQEGLVVFRLPDHYQRLLNSAKIMGIDTFEPAWSQEQFTHAVQELVTANQIKEDVFVRAMVHVDELLPGTLSRGLTTTVGMFVYEAKPILSQNGVRLKTSLWRRIPDFVIPSRAKINGAYINSVLAKQEAVDSGYDDCIFLDAAGHVCELSAANIFIVRDGTLITPGVNSDILEGINRRTVLELAHDMDIPAVERDVDLTELYVAEEMFACGTSSFIAPIIEVDARRIGREAVGPLTKKIREKYERVMRGQEPSYSKYLLFLK